MKILETDIRKYVENSEYNQIIKIANEYTYILNCKKVYRKKDD